MANRASFVRAAEHLHIAPSTLSQTVRALEDRLGVSLLNRTTRRVSLTSAGTRLLARFAPALDEMQAALAEAHDARAQPRGLVRLHALRPTSARHVEPVLGLLHRALPEVTLDLSVDDAPADVAAGGHDLVIRRAEFVDSGMLARDLGVDLWTCGPVDLWTCGPVDLWTCGPADLRTCGTPWWPHRTIWRRAEHRNLPRS